MGKMNFKSPLFAVFIDQFFDNLAYLQDFRNLAIEMRAHLLEFFEEVSNNFLFGNVSLLLITLHSLLDISLDFKLPFRDRIHFPDKITKF